jgi:hypothetical protein
MANFVNYAGALAPNTNKFEFFEDFGAGSNITATGGLVITNATSGTAALGSAENGTFILTAGATTDGQGVNVQFTAAGVTPTSGRRIEFECLITSFTAGISAELAFGLAVADTTLIASDAITNKFVGFGQLGGDDGVLDYIANNDTDQTTAHTTTAGDLLVVATSYRLGFVIQGTDSVDFYVNGNFKASHSTNIPTVALFPTMVVQANGGANNVANVDYIYCSQDGLTR